MTVKEKLALKVKTLADREHLSVEEATKRIFHYKRLYRPTLFGEICRMVREMKPGQQLMLL